jgi:hypothetical protein
MLDMEFQDKSPMGDMGVGGGGAGVTLGVGSFDSASASGSESESESSHESATTFFVFFFLAAGFVEACAGSSDVLRDRFLTEVVTS